MMDGPSHLAFLTSRRSVRAFRDEPIDRAALRRVLEAATKAPSSTNRQPWRFAVVLRSDLKSALVAAVRARTEAIKAVIRRGHHAEDFGSYGDFFWEPLAEAKVIVVPQHRAHADQLAALLASGGADPADFTTAAAMRPELCATSAAVMALLLQAHAEGLGACWMAGPTVARDDIHALLGVREPWCMVGAIALGVPVGPPPAAPERRPIDKVVTWYDEEGSDV
jgi:nitroreductase